MADHEVLAFLAKHAGFSSVRELCRASGISRATLYRASASRDVSVCLAERLRAACGITRADLKVVFALVGRP
jgi:hypothetical protein